MSRDYSWTTRRSFCSSVVVQRMTRRTNGWIKALPRIFNNRQGARSPFAFEALENRTLLAGDFGFAAGFTGSGSPSFDMGTAVVADQAGNVYATGYFQGTVDFNPQPEPPKLRTVLGGDEVAFNPQPEPPKLRTVLCGDEVAFNQGPYAMEAVDAVFGRE